MTHHPRPPFSRYWRLNPTALLALDPPDRAARLGTLGADALRAVSRQRHLYLHQIAPDHDHDPNQLCRATRLTPDELRRYLAPPPPPGQALDPYLTLDWDSLNLHQGTPHQYLELLRLVGHTIVAEVAVHYRTWVSDLAAQTSKAQAARITGLSTSRISDLVKRHTLQQHLWA